MKQFDLTVSAKADLMAIARYTQGRWGVKQRNAYLKEIDQVFRELASSPLMGKACNDVRSGYRKFPHGSHVIFYKRVSEELLLIVRVLHAAMDVDSNLGA